MRPGSYFDSSPSDRPRGRRERSSSVNRKARQRRIALEGLEPRTLLSTLPPAIIDQSNLSGGGSRDNSDESAPSIAVNPMNPDQVVATWTQFDTDLPDDSQVFVRARVSLDGGAS